MAIGEVQALPRILQNSYIINKNTNMDPTGETIRDVYNLEKLVSSVSSRPMYVETTKGAVQINRCSIDTNKFNLYYNDERIRTLPFSRGRLDHSWRFYPEKMIFAKETTKQFLYVYDRKRGA